MTSHDTTGMRTQSYKMKLLEELNMKITYRQPTNAKEKFKHAVLKVKTLNYLLKRAKVKIAETYRSNPDYLKFFYLVFVFFYFNIVVFIWIPINRNPYAEDQTGLDKLVFTNNELKLHKSLGEDNCVNYLDSNYAKLFY